jgi:hypothetical protein
MPDVLEAIAEADAAVLSGWAAVYRESEPRVRALPEVERARELRALAREFTRRAAWAADTAEGWLSELKIRLRDGMGGHKLRALLASGRTLCGQCRSVVEVAGDLWHLVGMPDAVLEGIVPRIAAVEAEIAYFERRTREPTPEELEAFFRRAMAQERSGKMLTLDEARALIRKAE